MSKSRKGGAQPLIHGQNHSNPLEILYDRLLEALRHREQEVFRYLAIVAPAIGGFIWLAYAPQQRVGPSILSSIGLFLLLTLGASYCVALSYNYRYLLAQISVIEKRLRISEYILKAWPKDKEDHLKRAHLGPIPWCSPPEVIKVFWYAFLILIVLFSVGLCMIKPTCSVICATVVSGVVSLIIAWLAVPVFYGLKLHNVYSLMKE